MTYDDDVAAEKARLRAAWVIAPEGMLRLYSCDLVSRHGFGIDSPPDDLLDYVGLIQGDQESIERYDRVWSAWKQVVPWLVERYMLPELAKNGFEVEIEPALWMNHNCVQATRVNSQWREADYGWRHKRFRLLPEYVEVPMETVLAVVAEWYALELPKPR